MINFYTFMIKISISKFKTTTGKVVKFKEELK